MAKKRKRKTTWRERNPELYRERQRKLMQRRRMEAKGKQVWVATAHWHVRIGKRWGRVDALTAAWLLRDGVEVRLM